MKNIEIKKIIGANTISKKNGVYTARWGFFYRMDRSPETQANKVMDKYPNATIVDKGEIYKPFRGGSSIANSSHFFVKFSPE